MRQARKTPALFAVALPASAITHAPRSRPSHFGPHVVNSAREVGVYLRAAAGPPVALTP